MSVTSSLGYSRQSYANNIIFAWEILELVMAFDSYLSFLKIIITGRSKQSASLPSFNYKKVAIIIGDELNTAHTPFTEHSMKL